MGDEVYSLEKKLSKKLNTRYVVTCANGTDALNMSLMTCGFKKNSLDNQTGINELKSCDIKLFNSGKLQRDMTYIDDITDGILGAIEFKLFKIISSDNLSAMVTGEPSSLYSAFAPFL